jgi:DNA-binding MarR family transcriptional regulator
MVTLCASSMEGGWRWPGCHPSVVVVGLRLTGLWRSLLKILNLFSILGMTDELGGPQENAGFLLWRLALAWRAHAGTALRPLGLTHTEYVLLALLFWHSRDGNRPSQRELADLGGLDQMLVSKTVRALAAAGLVVAVPDPADRRSARMALTDDGRVTFRRAALAVGEAHQQFLAPLGDRAGAFIRDLQQLLPAAARAPRPRARRDERTKP